MVNKRKEGAGTLEATPSAIAMEALAQTQLCNAAFAAAGVTLPQPLALHTVACIQIAIIAGAITNLIK